MIKRLDVQNFQSHEHSVLAFEPGVNVIVGPSDSGKSAIIRALRWATWNRPLGDSFRSHWGGDTKVEIETDDCTITRFKGKGGDKYILSAPEEDDLKFKAFGTETPEEITEGLNMSELNLQAQMDSAFLLSNNPGEVSRHFNKVANIDKIDSSLKAVESWVRSINQDIRATENEIERLHDEAAEFEYLNKVEARVEILEQLEQNRTSAINRSKSLSKVLEGIESITITIEEQRDVLRAEKPVNLLLTFISEKRAKEKQAQKLQRLGKNIVNCRKEIKAKKSEIECSDFVESILVLYDQKRGPISNTSKLGQLLKTISRTQNDIENKKIKLNKLKQKWHNEMPDICPLCGHEVK